MTRNYSIFIALFALPVIAAALYGAGAGSSAQAGDRYERQAGGYAITCSSNDGGRHYCNADTRGGVRMTRQRSGSACREGYSWGYDRRGIWVDHGCRADFQVLRYGGGANRPGRPGPGYGGGYDRPGRPYPNGGGSAQIVTCSSDDGRRHYCNADTSRGVRMVNQRSGSPCRQGSTWGYDRRGIWVDRGCRADFAVGGGR